MPTLILPARYTEDAQAVWQAAVSAGWRTERIRNWREDQLPDGDLAFYGESLLGMALHQYHGLTLLEPTLDWLARLPATYTRRTVVFSTLAEVRSQTFPLFVKPADEKSFTAKVYEIGADLPAPGLYPESTLVLTSTPVAFTKEFRSFVLERQVVTSSIYFSDGQVTRDADGDWRTTDEDDAGARSFINRLLADPEVPLPPGVVIDVAREASGEWMVIEANPAWGSGIYGCDPQAILPLLQRICRRAGELAKEDMRWVINR